MSLGESDRNSDDARESRFVAYSIFAVVTIVGLLSAYVAGVFGLGVDAMG